MCDNSACHKASHPHHPLRGSFSILEKPLKTRHFATSTGATSPPASQEPLPFLERPLKATANPPINQNLKQFSTFNFQFSISPPRRSWAGLFAEKARKSAVSGRISKNNHAKIPHTYINMIQWFCICCSAGATLSPVLFRAAHDIHF